MSGDHNMYQKTKSYLDDFECPRCGHCCQSEVHMNTEAMQMALEALESDPISHAGLVSRKQAITALRQALETEQEPVATVTSESGNPNLSMSWWHEPALPVGTKIYTSPPKQWVGLTDEEIQDLSYLSQKIDEGNAAWFDRWEFARAIEAKLREKNKW